MIFDKVDNLSLYLPDKLVEPIFSCLRKIDEKTPDGIIDIDGKDVYLRVMSYPTSLRECPIEAHNKYVDIQSVLVGAEGIEVFDRSQLDIKTQYDDRSDVAFFHETEKQPIQIVNVYPGFFALLFPHEAHRPQIAVNDIPVDIKKYVIKIRREYFDK